MHSGSAARLLMVCSAALARSPDASASNFVAITPFTVAPATYDYDSRALPGGDTLSFAIVPGAAAVVARLERRRADLSLAWTLDVPVEALDVPEVRRPFGRERTGPRRGWARLFVHGDAMGVLTWAGGELWRVDVDAATGSAHERQSLGPMSTPTIVSPNGPLEEVRTRAPVAESASGAWIAVGSGTPDGPSIIRLVGADQRVGATHPLTSNEAIVVDVAEDGSVTLLEPAGGTLAARTIPLNGQPTQPMITALPWLPERTAAVLEHGTLFVAVRPYSDSDADATRWLVRLRDLDADDPVVTLAVGDPTVGLHERSITRGTLEAATKEATARKAPETAWLGLALLDANPDGSILVGLRATWIIETTRISTDSNGRTSESVSYSYQAGDLFLSRVAGDSSLTWTTRIPVAAGGPHPDYLRLVTARTDEGLRLLYRDNLCVRSMALCTQLVDPATGAAGDASAALPATPSGALWRPELTAPVDDTTWVIGFEGMERSLLTTRASTARESIEDGGLLTRVDLAAPPPEVAHPAVAKEPVRDGLEYRSGSTLGRMSIYEAQAGAGVDGFVVGLGVGALCGGLMTAGFSMDEPSPGLIAGSLFAAPIGGSITAALVAQPAPGWWTSRSPDFQAGYSDSSRGYARRRGAIGGALGGFVGIPAGLVLVGIPVAFALADPQAP